MPNESTKHRTFLNHAKHNQVGKSPEVKPTPNPAEFLIDTNILPLVLIGKGVKSFGWGAVVAFLLGGLSVYGYAVVTPLPYPAKHETSVVITPTPTPVQTKMVRLHGLVRDSNMRPVTESFSVGVLARQLGPIQNTEGSFVLEVPESTSYDVAVWTHPESTSFYNGMPAQQDEKGLKLENPLTFRLQGSAAGLSAGGHSNTRARNEIARTFDAQ